MACIFTKLLIFPPKNIKIDYWDISHGVNNRVVLHITMVISNQSVSDKLYNIYYNKLPDLTHLCFFRFLHNYHHLRGNYRIPCKLCLSSSVVPVVCFSKHPLHCFVGYSIYMLPSQRVILWPPPRAIDKSGFNNLDCQSHIVDILTVQ